MPWTVAVALLLSLAIHLSISSWARERRRERELFYEHETAKRMLEKEGTGAPDVDQWLRGREAGRGRQRRETLILAAFVWTGLGLGMLAGLRRVSNDHVYWPLGFIPLFVGLSLATYLTLRRKETL